MKSAQTAMKLLFIDHEMHRMRGVRDAARISPFIKNLKPCRPGLGDHLKIALEYPLYLAEGAWWRLRHG
ncbi:MAG: hypothetical protein ACI4R9_02930 [Kiritimatiellia bacterium]